MANNGDPFVPLAERAMKDRGWTAYRLSKELEGEVTAPTVYSFLAGKPVKSDTLNAIFKKLGIGFTYSTKGVKK